MLSEGVCIFEHVRSEAEMEVGEAGVLPLLTAEPGSLASDPQLAALRVERAAERDADAAGVPSVLPCISIACVHLCPRETALQRSGLRAGMVGRTAQPRGRGASRRPRSASWRGSA